MKVSIKLFAIAKELVSEEVTLELADEATLHDVRRALVAAFPALEQVVPHSLWAVDARYAGLSTPVCERSEIALIPPVSGG